MSHAPADHYDRVTAAWTLLLGEELHYGVFDDDDDGGDGTGDLSAATAALTRRMLDAARIGPGHDVLDVGCGTGAPAARIARDHDARVTGITTSTAGVDAARARAVREGLEDRLTFEVRDGTDNGLPDASFDRVWVLESSHLMRRRDRLVAECARVLRPGGRVALCDIVRRRPMDLAEVRRLRDPLALLRDVFGDARMEPLDEYRRLMADHGLTVDVEEDLAAATRPTFAAWRANAERYRDAVVALIGDDGHRAFVDACDVLERFWDDGTLGYGLIAAARPA
ncbi:MAG: methyltransferase domain-containing protein [Solirubrobacteraceae bacterium]|nr:methyltransferase domain-containing protein [Solirubrobacteraceae bacterium]